jgi:uncharacterized protein
MSVDEPVHEESAPLVRELTKPQRRVLGVLVEKGFTTPEYYPLTLKAATTGCNQKSNRAPIANYSEDAVYDTLEELRRMGLAVEVHTESGRTERYRHLVRKRYPFTEPQMAVITELWLRGRQQLGELRSRASRMVPIESLEELREALAGLIEQGFVRASGPLERRGVEVDHAFYPSSENVSLPSTAASEAVVAADSPPSAAPVSSGPASGSGSSSELAALREENQELRAELETLRERVEDLTESLDEVRRSLGI